MRMFFASSSEKVPVLIKIKNKMNILISFEYYSDKYIESLSNIIDKYFIFDSGAFSVWKSNKTINIDDYILKINQLHKVLGDKLIAINLDVIPGSFGNKPTNEQVIKACKDSYNNYLYIKNKTKCKIMPVFHQHDHFEWLDTYIKDDCFLLGISPANDCSTKQRMLWLDQVFYKVKLNKRCHGLAATSLTIMSKYPFYSCDSASWQLSPAFGSALFFDKKTSKIKSFHYTDKKNVFKQNCIDIVDGYDMNNDGKTNRHKERRHRSVLSLLEAEKYLNDLWKKRGIVWND